jgi:hypothetical protein
MAASWSEGPSVFSSHAADLLVKIKKNKKNNTDAGAQPGAAPNNSAAGSGNKCEGEHACPAGMVVLDKPNKYGACCEAAKEGVCKKGLIGTPPNCTCPEGTLPLGAGDNPCVAKENCPFPGQVGNPPNCECPKDTEFVGYKGCVKYEDKSTCKVFTAGGKDDYQSQMTDFTLDCQKRQGKVKGPEDTVKIPEGGEAFIQLCCLVRYYEK